MYKKVLDNFYLRNIIACFLYISPDIFQDLADIEHVGWTGFAKDVTGHFLFFIFFVFHNKVLYEKLLARKKYLSYLLAFFVTMFLWRESTSYLMWLAMRSPSDTVYHIEELQKANWVFWIFIYWADLVYCWIALGVYLSFRYFRQRTELLEMDNVRKELEIKQLNEQLNPHFLFNALNNIYSHILRSTDSGKELVLKLSELMRYILDSSKKKYVSLDEELAFIEHYIAFEHERLGERCLIRYNKDINGQRFNIVPLILFNFIENAFKHGTASVKQSEVFIDIHANDKELRMTVKNNIFNDNMVSTGTGLENASKRLSLLYPGRYALDIHKTQDTYNVELVIQNIR